MEFSNAEKQKYLRHAIIDQNYDGETFAEFMGSQKPNGDDIENWTFTELKACVDKFKASHSQVTNPKADDSNEEPDTSAGISKQTGDTVTQEVDQAKQGLR